jgi:hypothetical protein
VGELDDEETADGELEDDELAGDDPEATDVLEVDAWVVV